MKPSGLLVIDKPIGPTSHDVVARVRRALGERRVGHAGTLDPLASGVLVVVVGAATKLVPYLTAHDKRYVAVVALGVATDTLDAAGKVVAREALDPELVAELGAFAARGEGGRIGAALDVERARREQVPPAFSAIHVDGERSYVRARAGVAVELAARAVEVRRLALLRADDASASLEIELDVGKGYYVRAFARDLGATLGVPAHLAALRRLASGPFTIAESVSLGGIDRAALQPAAAVATRALGSAVLTASGVERARDGKLLDASHFDVAPGADPSAWLSPEGALVAIGRQELPSESGGAYRVVRGFVND